MKLQTFLAGVLVTMFAAPAALNAGMHNALNYGSAVAYQEVASFYEDVNEQAFNEQVGEYYDYEEFYEEFHGDYAPDAELGEESEEEAAPLFFVTTARLNLRSGPSTAYPRVVLAPAGRRVTLLDIRCGEWFYVDFEGTTGYMYAAFLREATAPGVVGTVEMLHWSEARRLMTPGMVVTLIDVRTGLSWQVAAMSNGNHSDIETITAEDTAIKRQAFNGVWTWTPRPVLVLIGDRTIAASVNGMPHAGSTRSGNNMNGHVCLHFYGSRTHSGSRVHERDHQSAVREAFNTASAWANVYVRPL